MPDPQQPRILSDDPTAGTTPASGTVLSDDPNAGVSSAAPTQPDNEGFLKSYWQQVDPIAAVQAIVETMKDPDKAADRLVRAHQDLWKSGGEDLAKGNYADAAVKRFNAMIPLFGLVMQHAAEQGKAGDYAGLLGTTAGMVTNLKMPQIVGGVRNVLPGASTMQAAPEVMQAIRTGQSMGVPVDAATATGNPLVAHAQKLADVSLGGAIPGQRAAAAQQAGLEQMGTTLAGKAGGVGATPESAGQAIRTGVEQGMTRAGAEATTAYDDLRQIEAANQQQVQTGTRTVNTGVVDASGNPVTKTVPVMETLGLPTDMRPVKAILGPLEQRLSRGIPLSQQELSPALTAVRQILNGADMVSLSTADETLGLLKKVLRESGEIPLLRGKAGWVAKQAIDALSPEVDKAVAQGGPNAPAALAKGRAATALKFEIGDLFESLKAEPVRAFDEATLQADRGIDKLRHIQQVAPQALPEVGHAYLDQLMNGPKGPLAQWTAWQKLGPATKALLYPDQALRSALDDYFLLAKKLAEHPNPSGSALGVAVGAQLGGAFVDPVHTLLVSGGGGYLASKFFHSAAGVRFLTEGLRLPAGTSAAARWASQLSARLRQAVPSVPAAPIPAVATSTTPDNTP